MSDDGLATEEIMDGVYQTLCNHGYAALTMQDIADECSKSKSLLHYHYDTKEDLLVAFLDQLITDYEETLACRADTPPVERLVEFVAQFVFTPDDSERASFHLALLEMRSQGPFNDRIQAQLRRSDDLLRDTVADILRDGIEDGVFEDVDVDRTAAMIVATLDGARTRQITLTDGEDADETATPAPGETYTRLVAEEVVSRVVDPLLVDDVTVPSLDSALDAIDE